MFLSNMIKVDDHELRFKPLQLSLVHGTVHLIYYKGVFPVL